MRKPVVIAEDAREDPRVRGEAPRARRPEARLGPRDPSFVEARRRDRPDVDVREDVEDRLRPERSVGQKRPATPAEPGPRYGETVAQCEEPFFAVSFGAVNQSTAPAAAPTPATMKPTVEIVPIVL